MCEFFAVILSLIDFVPFLKGHPNFKQLSHESNTACIFVTVIKTIGAVITSPGITDAERMSTMEFTLRTHKRL